MPDVSDKMFIQMKMPPAKKINQHYKQAVVEEKQH
jgi:hypothetical protein